MDLHKANIEKIKWSLVTPDVRFADVRGIMKFRRANMTITQMIYITKQPVMDFANNLYNPKALIMIILN